MSQPPPWGRETPRWSVEGQLASTAASMAGLPGSSAIVSVGPPLSWSPAGSSSGSWLMPGQLVSGQLRLPPPSAIGKYGLQFPPEGLFATIVFWSVIVAPTLLIPPPEGPEFAENVLFVTVTVPP